jgi:hypothetical protein
MGNNWWLLGVIVLGMACQASASIAVAVITATTPGFEQVEVSSPCLLATQLLTWMLNLGRQATKAVVYIWVSCCSVLYDNLSVLMTMILQLTATLFVDMCLTGSIIYGLLKSKTGYSETSRLINRLVM